MKQPVRKKKGLKQDFWEKWGQIQELNRNSPVATLVVTFLFLVVGYLVWQVIFRFESPLVKVLGFNQTLWSWLDLLIIPVALAIAAYIFNKIQKEGEHRIAERREEENRQRDDEKQSRDTFKEFVDAMERLLLNQEGQLFEENHSTRAAAQARAKHALAILNNRWYPLFFQFLLDSKLTTGLRGEKRIGVGIFQKADLRLINLDHADLSNADLQYVNLEQSSLYKTRLINVDLSNAMLIKANLSGIDLTGSTLSGSKMNCIRLDDCILKETKLSHSNLSWARIRRCKFSEEDNPASSDLSRVEFEYAVIWHTELQFTQLREAKFLNSRLRHLNFHSADLTGVSFNGSRLIDVNFGGAKLSGVYLNNASLDEKTLQTLPVEWQIAWEVLNEPLSGRELPGKNFEDTRLEEAFFDQANLANSIFRNAILRRASFVGANLQGANFEGANLTEAKLEDADLRWVNWYQTVLDPRQLSSKNRQIWEIVNRPPFLEYYLKESVISGATLETSTVQQGVGQNLSGKDLSEANFQGANLSFANLRKTNLKSSDLRGATLDGADFTRAYLKDALIPYDLDRYVFSLRGATMSDGSISPVNEQLLENALEIIKSNLQPGLVAHNDLVVVQRYDTGKSKLASYLITEVQPDDEGDQRVDLPKLAQEIESKFNESDIQDLCFKLGVDYENVYGHNKADKARELVLHFDRRSKITELIEMLGTLRPNIEWRPKPKRQKSTSIVSKMDIAIVVDVARPTVSAVAKYLDEQNIDANFVLFQHVQSGSFLSVDDDWEQLTKTFSEVMNYVKREFSNQRIRFFLAGPVSIIFAMGCVWGTVDEATVYHYEGNTYHPVLNITRALR